MSPFSSDLRQRLFPSFDRGRPGSQKLRETSPRSRRWGSLGCLRTSSSGQETDKERNTPQALCAGHRPLRLSPSTTLFPSVLVEVLRNSQRHRTEQFRRLPRPVSLLPQVRTIFYRGGKGGLRRVTRPQPPGYFCSPVLSKLARSRGPLNALRLPRPRGPIRVDADPSLTAP